MSETEKKENPIFIIIFFIIAGLMVNYIIGKKNSYQDAPKRDEAYLTSVRQEMMENFDPEGITKSGYCVVSFEINEEGWINKRQFVKKSDVEQINSKVFDMLSTSTIVSKPPKAYTNNPIELEFGCTANNREVSCYSKNVVKNK